MKEDTKKSTKPQVKIKDMAPKKDAKGGSMHLASKGGPVKAQNKVGGPHTSF